MKIRINKADRLWSLEVRKRDGKCRSCGKAPPYRLEAHHILPRARSSTRYLLANGITLCSHCHVLGDRSAHRIGKEFCTQIIGLKEYKRLEKLSLQYKSREQAEKEFLESLSTTPVAT